MLIPSLISLVSLAPLALAYSQITAPVGALTVGAKGTYPNITSAILALGTKNTTASSIFIQAGIYNEQVLVSYAGPLSIYGQTVDTTTFANNTVTITFGFNSTAGGSNDGSATLRSHSNSFSLYNINVVNSFGTGAQALALSSSGVSQAYYGCSFVGHQDTVLTQSGTQYFSNCYVEGGTDYIFGQRAQTYFRATSIRSNGRGSITASAPSSNTSTGIYVFNGCNVDQALSSPTNLTGRIFLGRPWSRYARAVFINTKLSAAIAPAGWSAWGTSQPYTDTVTYQEFNNTGPGSPIGRRANFSSQLNTSSVQMYSIGNVLGANYATWIDPAYL